VGVELRAVVELRGFVGQEAFQAEDQGEVAAPLEGGGLETGIEIFERAVQCLAARRSGRERLGTLPVQEKGLTYEIACAFDVCAQWRVRRLCGRFGGFSQYEAFLIGAPPSLCIRQRQAL
jgi:hypothetical protein